MGNQQNGMTQQKYFYFLMKESESIHNALSKLIYADKMRLILKRMNVINNKYPAIKTKIESVDQIHKLFLIDAIDLHQFKQKSVEIKKNLKNVQRAYNEQNELQKDGDCNDSFELILDSFKYQVIESSKQCQIAKQNEESNEMKIKEIENKIKTKQQKQNKILQQIALLKRELIQMENDEMILKKELEQQQMQKDTLHDSMENIENTKNVNKAIYALMVKATNNIKSVCQNAEKLPTKYRTDLVKMYAAKKRLLKKKWREWSLEDIISWICSLDLHGKFKKYTKRLSKLKELEDECDDDMEEDENDYDIKSLLFNDEEEGIYDANIEQKNEEKNVSILELINDTVLKMCGIHDFHDRNVILMNIESLIKHNNPMNDDNDAINSVIFDEGDDYKDIDAEFTKDDDQISLISADDFSYERISQSYP